MITLLAVGAGGLIGAPARFVLDQIVSSRTKGVFPWGTFVVNVTGAFVLGLVSGGVLYHHLGHLPSTFVGTGFCGAYTTFSTFSWETVRLIEEGTPSAAAWNVLSSLAAGVLAAAAAMALAYIL